MRRPKIRKQILKYGVKVPPKNVDHAMELDEQSGNIFWQEAIKHEIYSLIKMESFEFKQEQSQFQPWIWISMDNTDSDL
jgi:hypothetical protein